MDFSLIDLAISAGGVLTLISTDGKTGIRWIRLVWKSNDLSSVSQGSKTGRTCPCRKIEDSVRNSANSKGLGYAPKFYGVVKTKAMRPFAYMNKGEPESPVGEPLAPGALSALQILDPNLTNIGPEASVASLANWITHETIPSPIG